MLYYLLAPLSDFWFPFNVFRYVTFRTACSALTALLISLVVAPSLIRRLRAQQIGQTIREDGPESHASKEGTPTMGGVVIVGSVVISTLCWVDLANPFPWITLGGLLGFASIGFVDDYFQVVHPRRRGLSVRSKLLAECATAAAVGGALLWLVATGRFTTTLQLPFFKELASDLGYLYLPFCLLVLVGSSNAVNLTDGLDGLATGSALVAATTYTAFSYLAGHAIISGYLGIVFVPEVAEVTIFAGALVGACLGFLWFNCYPAEVFMGDTGSLALGGAIGTIALVIKQEIALLLVGGLFCVEALSVIIQVAGFKLTGKRVFRMAPLHHHFELAGWPEPKVIVRFWILAVLFALISLATLKLR